MSVTVKAVGQTDDGAIGRTPRQPPDGRKRLRTSGLWSSSLLSAGFRCFVFPPSPIAIFVFIFVLFIRTRGLCISGRHAAFGDTESMEEMERWMDEEIDKTRKCLGSGTRRLRLYNPPTAQAFCG
ncbi:unnamed protein product [Merluccius merluccius]